MYIYMYIYMYICIYICIYVYICIYTGPIFLERDKTLYDIIS